VISAFGFATLNGFETVPVETMFPAGRRMPRSRAVDKRSLNDIGIRITELEEVAGTPLLQRHAWGVSLTPAGQSLLHYARQMLQIVDRMRGELSEYAGGLKGVVRLHASTSALVKFLPAELQLFLERYPMIRLQIEERTGAAIVRAVADGSADVGILGNDTPLQGLAWLPYHTDRLALGVPIAHPLARRKAIHFAEALEYDFVGQHAESSLSTSLCRSVEVRLGSKGDLSALGQERTYATSSY
jgi:DNA-binding transcriptional LysR family regulator